jgi:hypothetical protein
MARLTVGLLGVVCLAMTASVAAGYDGSPYAWGCYGRGFGYTPYCWGSTSGCQQERIPYSALFPPVYYTYPVGSPYGYNPFAYAPHRVGQESQAVSPLTIVNVYAGAGTSKDTATPTVGVTPLRIKNPFAAQTPDGENRSGQSPGKR